MREQQHIINASANLLGICFVLVTGLKLTGAIDQTIADDLCLVAAFGFLSSCIMSYLSLRTEKETKGLERSADIIFITSMVCLLIAVVAFARELF